MPNTNTYTLLNFRFFFATVFFVISCLLCWLNAYAAVQIFGLLAKPNYGIKVFAALFYMLLAFLLYRSGQFIYMYSRYLWHERFTKVEIDPGNKIIIVTKYSKSYTFTAADTATIEFHLATVDHRNPLYGFGYTKMVRQDGIEVIITSFILNHSNVENLFDGVKQLKKLDDIIYLP